MKFGGSRESFFRKVLQNEEIKNKEVNLQQPENKEVEETEKESVMDARDVLFERKRSLSILKEKFGSYIDKPEELDNYCEQNSIGEGLREDIRSSLPKIVELLNTEEGELFNLEMDYEDYEDETAIYKYITNNLKQAIDNENINLPEIAQALFDSEVDGAIKLLEEVRKRPVLSHRVLGFGKSEASFESIKNAVEDKISEMEFDIRASKDSVPIVHHNATLGALANRPEAVRDLEAGELKEIELTTGEHLATLRNVFELAKETDNGVTKFNIDIKDFEPKTLDSILDLISEYKFEHRVAIVSWVPQTLQYMYEKNPNLSYSLSFYPEVRGLSRKILETIDRTTPHGKPLFGKFATWFAKRRAESINSTGSEVITDTVVLDAEKSWQDNADGIVGKHTMGLSSLPYNTKEATKMARVLRNGSINMMAFEELFDNLCAKLPAGQSACRSVVAFMDKSRGPALAALAKRFEELGIKVNMFDYSKSESINKHFENFEAHNVQGGVVYSSNPDNVARLSLVVDD